MPFQCLYKHSIVRIIRILRLGFPLADLQSFFMSILRWQCPPVAPFSYMCFFPMYTPSRMTNCIGFPIDKQVIYLCTCLYELILRLGYISISCGSPNISFKCSCSFLYGFCIKLGKKNLLEIWKAGACLGLCEPLLAALAKLWLLGTT